MQSVARDMKYSNSESQGGCWLRQCSQDCNKMQFGAELTQTVATILAYTSLSSFILPLAREL